MTLTLVNILIAMAWIPAVGFPFVYSRVEWGSTLPGKAAMVMAVVIAIVMTLAVCRAFGWHPPDWLRAISYALVLGGLWTQFLTLLRVQYRRRDRAPLGDRQPDQEEVR